MSLGRHVQCDDAAAEGTSDHLIDLEDKLEKRGDRTV